MKATEPTGTKTRRVLNALRRGRKLTVREALLNMGVYALSQEVGRIKRLGWPVQSRLVKTATGARVSEYRLG